MPVCLGPGGRKSLSVRIRHGCDGLRQVPAPGILEVGARVALRGLGLFESADELRTFQHRLFFASSRTRRASPSLAPGYAIRQKLTRRRRRHKPDRKNLGTGTTSTFPRSRRPTRLEDARQYGFVSAGGGACFTRTLRQLQPGYRVFVCVPKKGYVGVAASRSQLHAPTPSRSDSLMAHGPAFRRCP